MPRTCPHCGLEIASDSRQCPNCGQPQDAGGSPQPENDRRFPVWQILPWTLLAAALLLLLPPLLRQKHSQSLAPAQLSAAAPAAAQPAAGPSINSLPINNSAGSGSTEGNSAKRSPRAGTSALAAGSVPVSAVPVSAVPVSDAPVPLTVTLYSASRDKHVVVGTPVTFSAYAALPPGKSATLAVSYGRDNGPKSLLSLAQGSLSSTTWMPLLPGHYLFTASALDSRKNGAFSRPVSIFVDAPVPASRPAAPARVAARPAPSKPSPSKPSPPKSAPAQRKVFAAPPAAARPSAPYRVAAAVFPFRRIAATLAAALRGRGFHAVVRAGADGNGKPNYRVETGDFAGKADANAQVRLLKKDGYPAYLFQAH